MQPVLFDTSCYIASLRIGGAPAALQLRPFQTAPVWLSSVVLEELYAGAGPRDLRAVERLEHDYERVGRILVPNLSDWALTGRVLAQLGAKYGYERIGRGRLTNDALIAMSAARQGIMILTANQRDFAKLAEFRPLQWKFQA